ncbi:flagellar basal body-associated FliL family protein [Pseudotabrizicola algicola]|uniref:Flagellar protein FliL n=1 Tax=Pseudotabrizicola algicola TaxID=2709381 RepID=A0A6B3RQW6_9RHOB|nr:flagellar basal body-associated FliL family protein [Pseudotabrizicola algicola]NEX46385.1 flagellar basal body-associated protein FliL [Pseudotabrizicola algicola]
MQKLLPIILVVLGTGAGLGAGVFLRPPVEAAEGDTETTTTEGEAAKPGEPISEFVKLTNQFIVPVVEKNRISSLVILSLSLEVSLGATEQVYAQEPKLRDGFLQLLFDHANTGGFRGSFTDADNLVTLRVGLKEVASKVMGDKIKSVLITDMIRQDS